MNSQIEKNRPHFVLNFEVLEKSTPTYNCFLVLLILVDIYQSKVLGKECSHQTKTHQMENSHSHKLYLPH